MKQKCKFYGQQASERILCPEKVFRGFLVSTLTCQDCQHTSSRHENYLDLSLPVSVEKPMPPFRRKGSPETPRDKYKSKSSERSKKLGRHSQSESEESDADVEDNLSEDVANTSTQKQNVRNSVKVDANGNNELCPEKNDEPPETANKDDMDDAYGMFIHFFNSISLKTNTSFVFLFQLNSIEEGVHCK